ncbi:MAG: hypothetical protein PVG47_11005 [Chromatiales bacterium]|jgi:small-conductance mechanosensitive channel
MSSSINFVVHVSTDQADYRGVCCDMTWQVKMRFDKAVIGIPCPRHDIHIREQKAG